MIRLLFIVLVIATACEKPRPRTRSLHFDFDSLVNAQLRHLQNRSLHKTMVVNGIAFQSNKPLITNDWRAELLALNDLNQINLPMYADAYEITVKPDSKSNLTVKTWTAKRKAPIKSLELFYLDVPSNLKYVKANFQADGFYYETGKTIALDFNLLGPAPNVESYSIHRAVRYVWGELESLSVNGRIIPE